MIQTRFFYGWVVVGVSFICLAVAYAIWNSFSIFFVAMCDDFGWSRSSTSLGFSVFTITYALNSPLAGFAVDRFGPRLVMPVGALILAAGLILCSRVSEIWHLYVFYGIVAAIGVNTIGTMVNFTVLSNWFQRQRGAAIGIAAAGIGVGTLVLVPLCQYIMQVAGWRTAYVVLAAVVLTIVPVLTYAFQRHRPEDMGLLPDGGPAKPRNGEGSRPAQMHIVDEKWATTCWTTSNAIRTRCFWYLFFGLGFATMSHQSVMIHQVAYLRDREFDPMLAASVVGLVGLFGSLGKVFWGWLSDRLGRELTFSLGMGCVALGVLALGAIADRSTPWLMYLYAGFFGFGFGVHSPLASAISADLFQGKRFGSVYGALYIGSGGGSSLGPFLSGYLFDQSGSYALSLAMSVVTALLAIIGVWLAAPRRVRQVPGVAGRAQGQLGASVMDG